jgi:hypothetical protein
MSTFLTTSTTLITVFLPLSRASACNRDPGIDATGKAVGRRVGREERQK